MTPKIASATMVKPVLILTGLIFLSACNPTVRIETPTEPIRIEANITIKHEIRIIIEKEVEEIFDDDEGLF